MAGRSIANLSASVTASTKGFSAGMSKAVKSITGLNGAVAKFGSLAAGVAVGGSLALFNSVTKSIDEQTKLAQRMQLTNREFQTFKLAADRGGTSVEGFAKASRRLAVSAFDAVRLGTKESVESFERLGISMREVKTLSEDPVALFGRVAGALNKLTNPTERVALGTKLLGRSYTELIPALKGDALEQAGKDVTTFGLVLSQKATAQVEALRDRLSDLGARASGFASQIVANLTPAVLKIIDLFSDWIDELAKSRGGIVQLGADIAVGIIDAMAQVATAVQASINWVVDLINKFRTLRNEIRGAGPLEAVRDESGRITGLKQPSRTQQKLLEPFDFSAVTRGFEAARKAVVETAASSGAEETRLARSTGAGAQQLGGRAVGIGRETEREIKSQTGLLGKIERHLANGRSVAVTS